MHGWPPVPGGGAGRVQPDDRAGLAPACRTVTLVLSKDATVSQPLQTLPWSKLLPSVCDNFSNSSTKLIVFKNAEGNLGG